jgi:hypothetical protein
LRIERVVAPTCCVNTWLVQSQLRSSVPVRRNRSVQSYTLCSAMLCRALRRRHRPTTRGALAAYRLGCCTAAPALRGVLAGRLFARGRIWIDLCTRVDPALKATASTALLVAGADLRLSCTGPQPHLRPAKAAHSVRLARRRTVPRTQRCCQRNDQQQPR